MMIRQTEDDDFPAIMKLMKSEPEFWQASWSEDVIERGVKSAEGLSFVYDESGQILGFICAHDLGFRAYLSALVVKSDARNRGIGKHLVKHVEHELKARGRTVIIADVWKNAQTFYKSLGRAKPDVILLRKTLI